MTPGRTPPIRLALREAERALDAAGVAESVADARLLLAHAMSASPTWVFAHDDLPVPEAAWDAFRALVERRARREPLQHLLGAQEFWTLRIGVTRDVLIPRPETELLVEAALEACSGRLAPRIADVGTGSGCIALALASELPLARLVATDVSASALRQARANAAELGLDGRIRWVEGRLAEPLRGEAPLDVLVANLPYVSRAEWLDLEPEVRDHDPRVALVGGEKGTELIEELARAAPGVLGSGGWMGLEVGCGQAGRVVGLLRRKGWQAVAMRADVAGIARVVEARRP